MKMFSMVDRELLRFCTRIAHWFQRLTGRTNFFIAKIGIGLVVVSSIIYTANYFHQVLSYPTHLAMASLYFFLLVLMALDIAALDQADQKSAMSSEKTAIPRLTGRSTPLWRLLWFWIAFHSTTAVLGGYVEEARFLDHFTRLSFDYGMMMFYYFIAVDPLPPCKSKIREWSENLSSLFTTRVPVGSES